jgi:hypothetical protein
MVSTGTDATLKPVLLSTAELQGFTISRKDHLFRLAETLIVAIDGWDPILDIYPDCRAAMPRNFVLIHRKMYRKFSVKIPSGFVLFYKATLAIGFSEDPHYAHLTSFLNPKHKMIYVN